MADPETGWGDLAAVMVTSSLAGTALSLSFPLLSLVLEAHGVDSATIGWSAAGHGLGVLLAFPLFGRVIGRLGPRGAMQAGLVISALAFLALPIEIDATFWFLARLVIGGSSALVFVVSEAAVNALADERRRSVVLGAYATFFCIGYAAGPLIVTLAGTEGWTPFLLGAGFLLMGIVPAQLARAADTALGGGEAGFDIGRVGRALRAAPLAMIAILIFGLVESGHFALLPLYGLAHGLDTGQTGFMLSVWISGNILFQMPVGWLADRWSRRGMLASMTVLCMVMLTALPWALASSWALWPLMLLHGASLGALYTLSLSLLGERFRGADLAVANTAFIVMIEVGVMLGPPIGGVAMRAFGAGAFVPTYLAALALLLLASFSLRRRETP